MSALLCVHATQSHTALATPLESSPRPYTPARLTVTFIYPLKLPCLLHSPCLLQHHLQVRTITALALATLAEAAHPYGIESSDSVLRPLWKGLNSHSFSNSFCLACQTCMPTVSSIRFALLRHWHWQHWPKRPTPTASSPLTAFFAPCGRAFAHIAARGWLLS